MMRRVAQIGMVVLLGAVGSVASAAGTTGDQQLAADTYVTAARRALEQSLPAKDVQIEPIGTHRDLRLPPGNVELRTRVPSGAARSLAHAVVWVDVLVDSRLRAVKPVSFTVHRWEQVLVAKEQLPARTSLVERQFEIRNADVAALADTAVKDVAALTGKRLKRELKAGAVLSARDMQDIPAVRTGDTFSIYARVGRVVVRTAAIAQRDAFTGDVIDAKVANTGERLRVRITGSNTAWISENETASAF